MEMALGPTSITEAREKAIDFTVPFDYEPWDILIPESIVSYDLTAYLFPFTSVVRAAAAAAAGDEWRGDGWKEKKEGEVKVKGV